MAALKKLQRFFHAEGDDEEYGHDLSGIRPDDDESHSMLSSTTSAAFRSPLTPSQLYSIQAIKESLKLPEGEKGREYEKYLQKLMHRMKDAERRNASGVTAAGTPLRQSAVSAAAAAAAGGAGSSSTAPRAQRPPRPSAPSQPSTTGSIDPAVHYAHTPHQKSPAGAAQANLSMVSAAPNSSSIAHMMTKVADEILKDQEVVAQKQEIANSIKTKASYLKSKTAMVEQEASLKEMQVGLLAQFEKSMQDIGVAARRASQALTTFDKDSVHAAGAPGSYADPTTAAQTDYTVAQLEVDCELDLTHSVLQERIAEMSSADALTVKQVLADLLSSKAAHVDAGPDDTVQELVNNGLDAEAATICLDLHTYLNSELLDTSATVRSLAALDAEASEAQRAVAASEVKYAQDPSAEVQQTLRAELQRLLERCQTKVEMLGSVCGTPSEEVQGRRRVAEGIVEAVHKKCDAIDQSINENAHRIVKKHEGMKAQREESREKAKTLLQECDARLGDNAATQQALAEKVSDLLKQYAETAVQRSVITARRTALIEQDAAEQKAFEARVKVQSDHLNAMQQVKDCLKQTDGIYNVVFNGMLGASVQRRQHNTTPFHNRLRVEVRQRHPRKDEAYRGRAP